jgi:hypothetical protein
MRHFAQGTPSIGTDNSINNQTLTLLEGSNRRVSFRIKSTVNLSRKIASILKYLLQGNDSSTRATAL